LKEAEEKTKDIEEKFNNSNEELVALKLKYDMVVAELDQ